MPPRRMLALECWLFGNTIDTGVNHTRIISLMGHWNGCWTGVRHRHLRHFSQSESYNHLKTNTTLSNEDFTTFVGKLNIWSRALPPPGDLMLINNTTKIC